MIYINDGLREWFLFSCQELTLTSITVRYYQVGLDNTITALRCSDRTLYSSVWIVTFNVIFVVCRITLVWMLHIDKCIGTIKSWSVNVIIITNLHIAQWDSRPCKYNFEVILKNICIFFDELFRWDEHTIINQQCIWISEFVCGKLHGGFLKLFD